MAQVGIHAYEHVSTSLREPAQYGRTEPPPAPAHDQAHRPALPGHAFHRPGSAVVAVVVYNDHFVRKAKAIQSPADAFHQQRQILALPIRGHDD